MITFKFYRENNDFKDILTDKSIKRYICTSTQWKNNLYLEIEKDGLESYILLRYGDDLSKEKEPDFTPVPFEDYLPVKTVSELVIQ